MTHLVPAHIPVSLEDIFRVAKLIKPFTRDFHVDVVDGVFVDSVSWPYGVGGGNGSPHEARTLADMFDIEFDLMVADALSELPRYLAARPKRVVVHLESCMDVALAHHMAKDAGVQLGLSASNDTPLDFFLDELAHADYAQCMGIRTIGSQGQPLDEEVFSRMRVLRERYPTLPISVDGSINAATIARFAATEAERLIVGSAIVKQADPEAAYRELMTRATKMT
jgi:ribulose-phosphate 3-epimerase